MQVYRLTLGMHAALSKHLEGEFASVSLAFKDGRKLKVVALNAWRRDRVAAFEHGMEEERWFDPSDVVGVGTETFDLDLMALSEAENLGVVLDGDAVCRLTPGGSAAGSQAAE